MFFCSQSAFIINQSKLKLVFANKNQLEKIFNVIHECPVLQYVVYLEEEPTETKESILEKYKENPNLEKIKFLFFKEVIFPKEKWISVQKKEKKDIATLIYTSGSTGMPKGEKNKK